MNKNLRSQPTSITVSHVQKTFTDSGEHLLALDDINFSAKLGQITCLMGSSGSGKSTLLRILASLDQANRGAIANLPPRIGFVFQNFGLFPWLNVEDNIGYGLKMKGLAPDTIRQKVHHQIETLQLVGFERSLPKELSGGMRQRVGLGRALVIEPQVLLLDEPFSALDEITARALRDDLLRIYNQQKITIIMVTHLAEEAAYLADKVVIFSKRPARVVAELSNSLPRPRNPRTNAYFKLVDTITAYLKG